MYVCSRCDVLKDGDYNCCSEDPAVENGLMCEDCATEAEGEDAPVFKQEFTNDQNAFIKIQENLDDYEA
jgi:hypothetical protein